MSRRFFEKEVKPTRILCQLIPSKKQFYKICISTPKTILTEDFFNDSEYVVPVEHLDRFKLNTPVAAG